MSLDELRKATRMPQQHASSAQRLCVGPDAFAVTESTTCGTKTSVQAGSRTSALVGGMERTAFGLLLFTGPQASDVAKMDWSDVSDDGIWVV